MTDKKVAIYSTTTIRHQLALGARGQKNIFRKKALLTMITMWLQTGIKLRR